MGACCRQPVPSALSLHAHDLHIPLPLSPPPQDVPEATEAQKQLEEEQDIMKHVLQKVGQQRCSMVYSADCSAVQSAVYSAEHSSIAQTTAANHGQHAPSPHHAAWVCCAPPSHATFSHHNG